MADFPTGNAFIIRTPKTDRLELQIAQDQKQKELHEQKQAELLDNEFSKNVSAIRDVDVPDAVARYQQYKKIGQELYKNGNRMTNEQRIAAQLEKQKAAASYYSLLAKSKELKEPEDMVQKSYFKDPNKLEDTTPDYLLASRRTPVLQHPGVSDVMKNTELSTKDFSKVVAGAMGGANGRPVKVANSVQDNGLTSTPTDYMALNSPSQFRAKVIEGVPTVRDKNKFISQHSYSDLAAQDILQKYQIEKEKPAFKAAYPNEPEYTAADLTDPFKKAVTLLSMEHILRNPPTAIVGKPYNNTEAVMDRKDDVWSTRNGVKFKQDLYKMRLRKGWQDSRDKKQQEYRLAIKYGVENEWLEKNYKALEDNTGETIVMTKPNGSKVEAKVMKVSSPFRKLLSVDGIEPDQVVKLPNGDVQGYFYQRYSKNDANIPKGRKAGDIVVGANGKMPIALDIKPVVLSRNDAKIAYGKTISSGKDLTGEIGDEKQSDDPSSMTETTKTRSLNASQRRAQ